jgi:CIC family chloride channel protein
MRLGHKDLLLLLAVACSAGLAAIFKSPVAAVVFSIEVIMIDLTMASLIPLLVASVTGVLTSYFFLGSAVLYPLEVHHSFQWSQMPYFALLGIFTGLISVYFTRMFTVTERFFGLFRRWWVRWTIGGVILGLLVFLFPSLFGEGYETVNTCLKGDYSPLFNESPFFPYNDSIVVIFILFLLVILFKVVASAVTFGAGGVGGIFAPSLFIGVFAGLLFAEFFNHLGVAVLPAANFAMVGMCGLIAGVMHAPLTGIFMIAEITQGYELIIPLMIVAILSYTTTKFFVRNSVYTQMLAERGELFTHDRDKTVLTMLRVNDLIEKDFTPLHPEATLRDLVRVISESRRNIYPVVDHENNFKGFIRLDDVRHIIFNQDLYDTVSVAELMTMPVAFVDPGESMETVARKFTDYDKYNLPVISGGKYIGFISRANVFATYRKMVRDFSEE